MSDIVVPALGESVTEATIASWLKSEGETVAEDEALAELETDKVTVEVNAPEAGVLSKISVAEGETVEVGAVIGNVEAGAQAAPGDQGSAPDEAEQVEQDTETVEPDSGDSPIASPAARKLIEENNLKPDQMRGTGKGGRITKEDVLNTLEAGTTSTASASKPEQAPAAPQPQSRPETTEHAQAQQRSAPSPDRQQREERVKMTRLRQSIAKRLKAAQYTAAMLTTFNEVDMGAVMETRQAYKDKFEKKHGVKLGFMSFFVKAAVGALKEFPAVNAEIDGDEIVYKNYYDISVAVSTPQGLLVPVVRDCDTKSMAQIEADIAELGQRAMDGKVAVEELQGGTFTITNGGIFGSLQSTPILNPPQSGILGMHKIQQRPMVMNDGSIQARPMMYLALSYDHRIVDGREAVSFLVRIKETIEDPQRLLLDI
jgi:2-oxoglutarate dehydrogenase E2 component (dihydrolipoamide succinyltransferase)